MPLLGRYILLLLLGAVAGGLMLGFIARDAHGVSMGAFFGVTTAGCWIALHFITKRTFSGSHQCPQWVASGQSAAGGKRT
jgi:hypothetical protein